MKKTFGYLLIFFIAANVFGQKTQAHIDSVKSILDTLQNQEQKADLLNELGTAFQDQNKDSALYYINEGLELSKEIEYKKGMGLSMGNIGIVYESFGEYEKAIEYGLKSLKIKEELDDKTGICITLNSIAAVYYYQDNLDHALRYFLHSLSIAEELRDTFKIAGISGNIGNIYTEKGNYEKALEQHFYSLKLNKIINNECGITLNNIGLNYFYLKDYKKALQYYEDAVEEHKKFNNMNGLTSAMNQIGELYMEQNEFSKAIEYCLNAMEIATRANLKYEMHEAYKNLSKIYSLAGNYKKAFEYHELFSQMKDSVLNEENQRFITEMNTKYETEKKEKEIEVQYLKLTQKDLELNKKQITIYAAAGGIFLFLLLTVFVFRGYRLKQKANMLLAEKNMLIEEQKQIVEEKNKDITDSITYAKRIQEAVLPEKEKILQSLPESFILYMPKDIVSGDFYWHTQTETGETLIAAADCTGHGVPGAFMSMIGSNTLTKIVAEQKIYTPSEILHRLNAEIKSSLKQKTDYESSKDGMDIALVSIAIDNPERVQNPFGVRLEYAGANRPLIYFDGGELIEIVADKTAIGGYTKDGYQFTNHHIELKKDSMIYFFSDGYTDQFGGVKGKKFMLKNLKELFKTIKNFPVNEQEKTLRDVFLSWKGNREQIDDILVIGIRV